MEGSSSGNSSTNSAGSGRQVTFRFPCKKTLVLKELYVDYLEYLDSKQIDFRPLLEDPVQPKPGYSFTMRLATTNENIFLNICHWEKLPMQIGDPFWPVGDEHGQLPIVITEPQMYRMNKDRVLCAIDIIVNSKFYLDILTKYIPAQQVVVLFATDAIFKRYRLTISRKEIQVLNTPYSGSRSHHWQMFVSSIPRREEYYERLIGMYLNIDVNQEIPPEALQYDREEENPLDSRSYLLYPVRTETAYETVKRLAAQMLSPRDIAAFQSSSRRTPPAEPEPTMEELRRQLRINTTPSEDFIDVQPPTISNLSTTNDMADPPQFIPHGRPALDSRGMPLDPANLHYDQTGMPIGPTGQPFDLISTFDVLDSDDDSNDTPNMAVLRDIFSKPGARYNPVLQGILRSSYAHLKDDNYKLFYLYDKIFKTLPTKKLPTFSHDSETDEPNPITMIPGSGDNLYELVERPEPFLLSPALEIQPISKMAAEMRLEELMNGASNFVALKNIIELYDVGDFYLFITVSSQDYENLDVFANVKRLIAFRNGDYYRDINLPKPVIREKARANFYNGIVMVVLPIDEKYRKKN